MKPSIKILPAILLLLMPVVGQAQKLGQVTCVHQDDRTFLYSSLVTLEIRTTLKCGEQVQILDRSDNFIRVRTEKGEEGFVAFNSIAFVKTAATPKTTATRGKQKHGAPAKGDTSVLAAAQVPPPPREIILPRQTPVHLKLVQTLSSATAHVGEEVNFEVTQDVIVGGLTVIAKGAPGGGSVTEAEPKKRMGKAGKLNVDVDSVVLANNQKITLRSFGAEPSVEQKSGHALPFAHGKDVTLAKDTEITAYVDADLHLKAASFAAAPLATAQSGDSKP
jgi:hypothetical protein